ncbi:MAG: Metal-dependent hydrolase of the beta-lactamase superfamily III-like protein, partial [Chromatiaceae bacterium]|nr:Metal-dependent hydrolase of the beta-lactamase superfamily III-like protein [Chromatiaceae bacterium]
MRWECLKLPLSSLPRASGYLLSQILPRPKLAVIAHFPVADDTVASALQSVQAHFSDASYPVPGRDIVWATDLLVLSVKAGQIAQRMGQVGDYTVGVPRN